MLKLPGNEPYLLLDMHHIISDGLSSQLLLGRLNQYYQELPVSMPELDYIDYAWWVSERNSQEENPCRAFWREHLPEKLPERELTPERPRPPVFDGAGGQYEFALPPALSERIAGFCEEQHVKMCIRDRTRTTLGSIILHVINKTKEKITNADTCDYF